VKDALPSNDVQELSELLRSRSDSGLQEETPDGAAANLKAVFNGERANTEAVLKSRRFRVENISNSSGAKFLRLSVW